MVNNSPPNISSTYVYVNRKKGSDAVGRFILLCLSFVHLRTDQTSQLNGMYNGTTLPCEKSFSFRFVSCDSCLYDRFSCIIMAFLYASSDASSNRQKQTSRTVCTPSEDEADDASSK